MIDYNYEGLTDVQIANIESMTPGNTWAIAPIDLGVFDFEGSVVEIITMLQK